MDHASGIVGGSDAVLIGGEQLGGRIGPCMGRIRQGYSSAAGPLSDRDASAYRGGAQVIQRLSRLQVEPALFGVFDQEAVAGERAHDPLDETVEQPLEGLRVRRSDVMEPRAVLLQCVNAVRDCRSDS